MNWPIEPIVTERLMVRDALGSDEELFERLYSDPEVRAYLGAPVAAADIPKRVAETPWRDAFTVEVTETGEPVGLVHIGPYRTGEIELSYEFELDVSKACGGAASIPPPVATTRRG